MKEILKNAINETKINLQKLNHGISILKGKNHDELLFDGTVKRFEDLFIRMAQLLGLALAREGVETLGPRNAIQEAVRVGWINDPDFWLQALDARSSLINNMCDLPKNNLINLIVQFAVEADVILNLLTEFQKK